MGSPPTWRTFAAKAEFQHGSRRIGSRSTRRRRPSHDISARTPWRWRCKAGKTLSFFLHLHRNQLKFLASSQVVLASQTWVRSKNLGRAVCLCGEAAEVPRSPVATIISGNNDRRSEMVLGDREGRTNSVLQLQGQGVK